MKAFAFYKFKAFPYATAQKTALFQQWNPLRKLSRPNKRLFRGRNRLFSIDSNRPLPKEIFLKIVAKLASFKKPNINTVQSTNNVRLQLNNFNSFSFYKKNISQPLDLSYYLVNSVRPIYRWNIFRFIFLKKMWVLSNPSLVPGIARPFKFKKKNIIKIRALKGFSCLLGGFNLQLIDFLLNKSWNMSNNIVPFFWNLPRTVESLKSNISLKIGLVFTIPMTQDFISRKNLFVNGFVNNKIQQFIYPGDYLGFNLHHFIQQNSIFRIKSIDKQFIFYNELSRKSVKKHKNLKRLVLENKTNSNQF